VRLASVMVPRDTVEVAAVIGLLAVAMLSVLAVCGRAPRSARAVQPVSDGPVAGVAETLS